MPWISGHFVAILCTAKGWRGNHWRVLDVFFLAKPCRRVISVFLVDEEWQWELAVICLVALFRLYRGVYSLSWDLCNNRT